MAHVRNTADICLEIQYLAGEAVSLAERAQSVWVKLGKIEELINEIIDTEEREITSRKAGE